MEENKNGNLSSRFEDAKLEDGDSNGAPAVLYFIGATLQLRGVGPICQPLVDSCGNVLVFNGNCLIFNPLINLEAYLAA